MTNSISEIIENCGFVRETEVNIFSLIVQGVDIADVISNIIPKTNPRTELFTLSVYLYGFTPKKRKFDYIISIQWSIAIFNR